MRQMDKFSKLLAQKCQFEMCRSKRVSELAMVFQSCYNPSCYICYRICLSLASFPDPMFLMLEGQWSGNETKPEFSLIP